MGTLWNIHPEMIDYLSLEEAYRQIKGDPSSKIPYMVKLFEDPKSRIALPGKIDLFRHDCLHLLLKQGFDSKGEAYVLGFTMGNDPKTRWYHLILFKLIAFSLYPHPYRMSRQDFAQFDAGVAHGRQVATRALNEFDFGACYDISLKNLRAALF